MTSLKRTIWLPALLTFMIFCPGATETGSSSVIRPVASPEFQQAVIRNKPINCEDLLAMLDHAIIEWTKLEGTHFIFIASRGTGEKDPKLIQRRFYYVEDYLKRKGVQYLFAEGNPVAGHGRIEVYVGGRLHMSVAVAKNTRRLCWGGTGA